MPLLPVLLTPVQDSQQPPSSSQQPVICNLPLLADAAFLLSAPNFAVFQFLQSQQPPIDPVQLLLQASVELPSTSEEVRDDALESPRLEYLYPSNQQDRQEQRHQEREADNNSATAKDERARNGQVNWHAICEQIITTWFETIVKVQDSRFKQQLDSQMMYCCKMRLKCTKRSVLAFLHLCAVNELIFLEFEDDPDKGFCGISGFQVAPNRSNEFYNRYAQM